MTNLGLALIEISIAQFVELFAEANALLERTLSAVGKPVSY